MEAGWLARSKGYWSPTREDWFEAVARDCGGCLAIVTPSQTVSGKRIPDPTEVMDVVAIQKGSTDPDRVIVLTAHIDSRVSDVMNATADARFCRKGKILPGGLMR